MKRFSLPTLLVFLLYPGPTQAQDERERLYGPHTYEESATIARELSSEQPATQWERAVQGEAADFIEFLTEDRLLVGMIEVNNRGQPSHGPLYLLDAADGDIRWEVNRANRSGGSYSLLQAEPLLLLLGTDDESAQFTALDPASGKKVWDFEVDAPYDVALAPGAGRLVIQFADGDRWRVRAVDLADGRRAWETRLEPSQADVGRRPAVRIVGDTVLVMSGAVAELSLANGTARRVIETPVTGAGWSASPLDDGVIVWDATDVALVERSTGLARWTATTAGEVQGVVVFGEHLIRSATSGGGTSVSRLRFADGTESWSYRVPGPVVSPIALEDDLILFTTDSSFVALGVADGASVFSTALPEDMPEGSPTFAPVMGMPDVIRTSPGRTFIARERAGVAAFALPSGAVDWYQPHYEANVAILNYTGEGRYAYVLDALFTTGRVRGLEDVQLPPSLSATTGGGGYLLRSAQRNYESARQRYAAGRTDASTVRMAAELAIAAQQLDIASGRLNAGVELAHAILSVGAAIKQAMQQAAAQGLIDRAQLAMQGAMRGQSNLFQQGHYVRPFYLEGRGRGVTLVDTTSGLRRDLIIAPHNPPSIAFGLDMPTFAVSPSGERLVAVGISLRADEWKRRDKWDTRVPNNSVLSHDVSGFEFGERMALTQKGALILAIVQQNVALLERLLASGADVDEQDAATGMTALHMAASFGNADLVRVLVDNGADVNMPNAQGQTPFDFGQIQAVRTILEEAGAEAGTGLPQAVAPPPDPNAPPPLATAALSGNADRVRQLLAEGADPNWVSKDGETPLFYAVAIRRADIVEMLLEAGADVNVRSKAGKRVMDFAHDEAMKELLEAARNR